MNDDKQRAKAAAHLAELLATCGPDYGAISQLALKLGLQPNAIRQWVWRGYPSAAGAALIQDKIGGKFTAKYMRPDL